MMQMQSRLAAAFVLGFALMLIAGCEHHEKDSHTEVFKTPEQSAADRWARQLQAHKELAVSVLHFSRPDIEAKSGEGSTIVLQADGVTRIVDLKPVEERIAHHANEERAILRTYLEGELRPFDVQRLRTVGFERVKQQAAFVLVNDKGRHEMQAAAGTSPILSTEVVTDLYRISVIRRAGQTAPLPITAELAEAWRVRSTDIDAAAMRNLLDSLNASGDGFIETIPFGPAGRTGNLKSDVDPAVILLPEFLVVVQRVWKTADDLVLFVPATGGIMFVEQHSQKLLDLQVPMWKKQLAAASSPLCEQFLLRGSEKLVFFSYVSTTQPATVPATKPVPYIAH